MQRTLLRALLVSVLLLGGAAAFLYLRYVANSAVPRGLNDYHVLIPTGATFDEVVDSLSAKGILRDEGAFRLIAEKLDYKRDPMRAGRFKLEPGMSMLKMVRHLRSGEQAPVNVVLTNERLPENVAAKVARFIEPDSAELLALFSDPAFLEDIGYTPETFMSIFIPNTYQFYWNTTPRKFVERMIKERDAFWAKEGRKDKAQQMGMTPEEVYTLASIVDRETLANSEKPTIAGVYLNRLRINMPLQADPTSVFATRDFETKRVTEYHTKFDSPYNTYMYTGLPPGPICMASISGIDAVLNAQKHKYIYFCATGEESGLHAFAESYDQHLVNAARYRQKLKERGLR
jgi:UPF0755 protein